MSLKDQEKKLGAFYDADSALKSVRILPEYVEAEITYEEMKTRWLVRFHNHIAVSQIGTWDEVILDHAEVLDASDLITQAMAVITKNNGAKPDAGMGLREFAGSWFHYRIVLIDGSSLDVVAADVTVEKQ